MRLWSVGPPVAFLGEHRASLACVATLATFGNERLDMTGEIVGRRPT